MEVLCFLFCVLLCCELSRTQVIPGKSRTNDGDYNTVNTDGSFDFGYNNNDAGASYHVAHGNSAKVVGGRFGARDPASGNIKETVYTAGPRGFRAKGPNVHRKMDLDQRPRGPIGNKDDPYFDPNEDPSYAFKFNTRSYSKNENADSRGDVKGHYSYVDDVGERHDVSYVAGRDTGFHVSSAHPDSPSLIGSPFHRAPLVRGESRPRGRTAVQRGLDGSYRFISAGPDQRRTESSDSHGNVRGSYTFLDDKGVQRTVHYIAGPGIGYRIVKNNKDPYIPSYFPTVPSAYDPDFVNAVGPSYAPDDAGADDLFKGPDGTAASGHVKPPPFSSGDKDRPAKKPGSSGSSDLGSSDEDFDNDDYGKPSSGSHKPGSGSYGSSGSGSYKPQGFKPHKPAESGIYGSSETGSYGPQNSGSYGEHSGGFGQGTGTHKPGSQGSQGLGSQDSGEIGNYGGDEDVSNYGDDGLDKPRPTKPSGTPGKRPNRPYRPSRPDGSSGNRPTRPERPTKKPYVPLKPFKPPSIDDTDVNEAGVDDYDRGKGEKDGPVYGIGFNIHNSNPGTTIIRNIGQDYFGVPPGVSVRAHVQSIDLYPYGSKPSPSEAIEKDKT